MEEFRERVARIMRIIEAWCEWGVLSVLVMFYIPILIFLAVVLLVLPLALAAYGVVSPLPVGLYIFAVMAGVGAYCLHKYFYGEEPDVPVAGRQIISEKRAQERSRSIMHNTRRKRK